MEPFLVLDAVAAPLDPGSVDTGQLLPARFLRRPRGMGFAGFLFHDLRFRSDGSAIEGFVLNRPEFRAARILVADGDFGIGSSREQAPWGLVDFGIGCVIAPGFGDIFHRNAIGNGILPVRLPAEACTALRRLLQATPGTTIRVDLPAQTVRGPDGTLHRFEIDRAQKRRLLEGLDDVGTTLRHDASMAAFETDYRRRFPWLFDATRPDA
jgi:3-isopropylmalate/(R)-2-methylmalate dehydratase small subunit